jgi:2,3-bisphosphoglycerate-independent phosphoglycerate mutase
VRPVCVIVRDGWGHRSDPEGNAVSAAHTPNIDRYLRDYPWTILDASGEAVGLPEGYQGSSEVGHLNMGAGRVVVQEMRRIDDALRDGSLFQIAAWTDLMRQWKSRRGRLHLLGLLQDQGVHAHQDQLFRIAARARSEFPEGAIVFHPFLDGRDTSPRSCLGFLRQLEEAMTETGGCSIGTVMGRYYAMDRSKNWRLTDRAYNCMAAGEGIEAATAREAVETSYAHRKTPDGVTMFDEYIPPHRVGDYRGIGDGDCVIHTNYRQDRAIQLSRAFIDPGYPGKPVRRPEVHYLGLTRYYDEFENYLVQPMDADGGMENLLGQVLSEAGLRQIRIAETQKFRHVTSFFNGKSTTPYEGEVDVEIKGRFDPATFASHPEMEAYNVTEELLARLAGERFDFILVNFANGDMVGHTGDFEAARKAIEVVDECVGRLVEKLLEMDAHVLITADHGNAEQMVNHETGKAQTSHSICPVELIYVARNARKRKLPERGKLSDIAPTVLRLLGLAIPEEMTADALVSPGAGSA